MAGIIPKHRIKGVDFCGSKDYCYIIRSDLGCYMKAKNFNTGSDLSVHALHPCCQNGDHYLADEDGYFYIIKGDEYRRVTDLSEDTYSAVFTLPSKFQGGDHYLSAKGWHYVIFQEKGTYIRARPMPTLSLIWGIFSDFSDELRLLPNCRDGLYFWGDMDHCYSLKPTSKWGVEYYKGTDLKKDWHTAVLFFHPKFLSIHPDVLNFLPGGLSITSGPAFGKWVNIKTVSNDSTTPVTWQRKITKRVGYSKEKMSKITHNWKIESSLSISTGALARLISNVQFSFSAEYGGSSVNTEKENWTEETEVEEELSLELKPHECLYVWQFQLGLGSEPVLFCRDLKITDKPNPPTEVPEVLQENTSTLTS